jgi:hypothetical protein
VLLGLAMGRVMRQGNYVGVLGGGWGGGEIGGETWNGWC